MNTAARILSEMDVVHVANVITAMNAPEASLVLQAMEPDDRVDILENVTGPLHALLDGAGLLITPRSSE